MASRTTTLQLPFQFDPEKLATDLATALEEQWVPHFNTQGYQGTWKVIPLYAPAGDATNIFALSAEHTAVSETKLLKHCLYFKEVIDTFQCPVVTARLLRLEVGAIIKPHRDHALGYEDGTFRIHIPIHTNPGVQFILNGKQIVMQPGECWYTNVNYMHSVENNGNTDRTHLVLDLERNEWTDQLFFSLAPAASFESAPPPQETPETVARIIEELKQYDNPANEALIQHLTKQLTAAKLMTLFKTQKKCP